MRRRLSGPVEGRSNGRSTSRSSNGCCSSRRPRRGDRGGLAGAEGLTGRSGVAVTTFITRFDTTGEGVRLAVKDLIDMEGVPTTAGCRAVADAAQPAGQDAPLLAGARAAGARIVGKTNLHELAFGASGVNDHFGTPVNPLDPALVP